MRASSIVIGFGSAVLALGIAGVVGWDAWHQFYAAAAGLGLGMAASEAAGLVAWWRDEMSLIEQRRALTAATEAATAERMVALSGPSEPYGNDVIDLDETAYRAQRAREQQVAHWHVFYRRLYAAGQAYGWERGTLTDRTSAFRVMSQTAWNLGTEALATAGVIHKDQTGTRAVVSEADWQAGRMWEKVPCPGGEPPDILPPPYTTTQPTTGKTTANQPVIEHKEAA